MSVDAQSVAPYLDAVVSFGGRGSTRFHVPGHKGGVGADPGLRAALGLQALLLDLPQDLDGIDLGTPPTPYDRAEDLAAKAYGARRSWFLTNGATQGNHALCLAVAALGAPVVMQRNSHASLIDGLVLSGGRPSFVAPEYDAELGMAHALTPESLERALAESPDARAAFVVSPTYYGMAAEVGALAEVAHAAGAALVVDQAWGPHFGFHPGLPPSALACGADAVLTSTHKIAASLTQSAILHLGESELIDPGAVAHAVRLTRSTSQSALLVASLDGARRQLALHGRELLGRTIAAGAAARVRIDAVAGCAVVGEELVGRPGVAGWDPLRVVIDVRGTGRTGYEVAATLRAAYDLHPELATHATVVLVLGVAEPVEPLERFARELAECVHRLGPGSGGVTALRLMPASLAGETVVAPRDAFLGRSEVVPVDQALGRISCESIAGYPPGIPALLPGERITGEVVEYLRALAAAGARLHGASDPDFVTIRALVE